MNNESTKKRNFSMFFITFFKKNLKIIIIIISIILIGFAVFIWLDIRNNNKNILISNQYNEAVILIKKDQKQKANRWLFAAQGEVNLLDTSQLEDLVLYIKNPEAFKLQ